VGELVSGRIESWRIFPGHSDALNGGGFDRRIAQATVFPNLLHPLDEPIPPPRKGNDVLAVLSVPAKRLSQLENVLREIRFLYEGVRPQSLHKVVLQDGTVAVLQENQEQVESFGRQRNNFLIPGQDPPIRVDTKRTEVQQSLVFLLHRANFSTTEKH